MSQPIFRQVPNRVFICISLKTPKTFTSTDAGIPCNVFNSDVFGVVLMYISHNILCLFFISVIRSERDKFVFMLLNIAEGKTPYMVWHWNDYYEPIFYITSSDKRLLPQVLTSIVHNINNSAGAAEIANQEVVFTLGVLMAGAVLVLMPIVLVFLLLQKQFMEGVERTGLVG